MKFPSALCTKNLRDLRNQREIKNNREKSLTDFTLKMQLDNIKRYMYFTRDGQSGGHASLMVGAGFSKNADKG